MKKKQNRTRQSLKLRRVDSLIGDDINNGFYMVVELMGDAEDMVLVITPEGFVNNYRFFNPEVFLDFCPICMGPSVVLPPDIVLCIKHKEHTKSRLIIPITVNDSEHLAIYREVKEENYPFSIFVWGDDYGV